MIVKVFNDTIKQIEAMLESQSIEYWEETDSWKICCIDGATTYQFPAAHFTCHVQALDGEWFQMEWKPKRTRKHQIKSPNPNLDDGEIIDGPKDSNPE